MFAPPTAALRTAAAAAVALLVIPFAASAGERTRDEAGTFTVTLDNDLFGGTDRYYTNGLRLAWRSPAYAPPRWLGAVGEATAPLVPEDVVRRWGLALGQDIYTPEDTARENPDPEDRPYAAWLYGSVSLAAYNRNSYSALELQLGVVGPAALGEQAQNTVHRWNNGEEAEGWDFQLDNEPGINLIGSRLWRYDLPVDARAPDGWAVGAVPSATVSLGNVRTHASAGLLLRAGRNLGADFGPPRIRPSVAGSAFVDPQGAWGGYVFAGIEGRAVARDIFLDGNTFQDSRSVDSKPLVGEATVGAALVFPWGRLSYAHIFRTEEFEGQDTLTEFGSVSLSLRF